MHDAQVARGSEDFERSDSEGSSRSGDCWLGRRKREAGLSSLSLEASQQSGMDASSGFSRANVAMSRLRRLAGMSSGRLHNPWWCSLLMTHNGFCAWWWICDYFGIEFSHRQSSYLPETEQKYLLFKRELYGWRFAILRPHRYKMFPWEM